MTITFPAAVAFVLAKPLIKAEEGYEAAPYICPAGKPTIGWGSTRYNDGTPVRMTDQSITREQAELLLAHAMMRVETQLRPLLKRQPTAHQYAAMISLCFNIGVGAHDGIKGDFADSTLLAKFNAGDTEGAAEQFPLWNKARVHGVLQPLKGLTRRRNSERLLFLTPDK